MRGTTLAASFLIAASLASAVIAGDPPGVTEEDRADLAWFAGLDYPKVTGKPFVRVRPGGNPEVRGVVLAETDARVRVLSLGLSEWDFERTAPGTADAARVDVEPLRAVDVAEAWLHGGPSPTAPSSDFLRGDEPSVQVQILVLANALFEEDPKRNGDIVHGLLAHARTLRHEHWRHYGVEDDPSKPLRERVAIDLASVETLRAKLSLLGSRLWGQVLPHTDRRGQLETFRSVLRRFPRAHDEAGVRGIVATLERMVREDAEHAKTAKPLEALSGDERIAELVFRLREQADDGDGAMGSPGAIIAGPYRELVTLGQVAVPHLIAALDDDSLSRYGSEGRSGFQPYVAAVGDLALMALEEIAGHRFVPPPGTPMPAAGPGYRREWRLSCRPTIEAWFAEVKAGREIDSLARRVEAGEWEPAERLMKLDPDRYSAAILRGFLAAKHPMTRATLLGLLAKRPGEPGLAAIREEAVTGDAWTRLYAAEHLAAAGDPAAPEALLAMWRERRDGGGPPTWVADHSTGRDRVDEFASIAKGLLAMDRTDVIVALAESLRTRSPEARRIVAREMASARPHAKGERATAMDAVFAQLLDDPEEYADEHGHDMRAEGLALRVRDVAAAALAASRGLVPPRLSEPLHERDVAVVRIANAWAAARGGAQVVEPVLPELPSADSERTAFVVRAVRVVGSADFVPVLLRTKLHALTGNALTSAAFADLAQTMIDASGDSLRGASLDVHRGAADDGVVVTLTVLEGTTGGWAVDALGLRGERFADESGSGSWTSSAWRDHAFLRRIAEFALAAQAGERAWLHVRVVRRPAS